MIDETIPGLTSVAELHYLERLVKPVPPSSNLCEVGAFLGRTAYVLAATRPDCRVFVVDPFDADMPNWLRPENKIDGDRNRYRGQSQFDTFKTFLHDCNNIAVCFEYSPPKRSFPAMDLIFIDAAHNYDSIKADLDYWRWCAVDPTALCGHDYCEEFNDVRMAVNEFAASIKKSVYVEPGTTIWKICDAA